MLPVFLPRRRHQQRAGLVIASQSGHRLPPLTVEQNKALATTPVEELLNLPFLQPDQVTDPLRASHIPRKCLGQLACNPFRRWMLCSVDPDELSPIQPDDYEGIEQVETNGWDNKQVYGGDVRRVVTQKRAPSLTWGLTALDHVLRNARLGDFPSLSSSPWMRGAPHNGFSMLIRRIKARSSPLICGRRTMARTRRIDGNQW
jgi:hypothetical protein